MLKNQQNRGLRKYLYITTDELSLEGYEHLAPIRQTKHTVKLLIKNIVMRLFFLHILLLLILTLIICNFSYSQINNWHLPDSIKEKLKQPYLSKIENATLHTKLAILEYQRKNYRGAYEAALACLNLLPTEKEQKLHCLCNAYAGLSAAELQWRPETLKHLKDAIANDINHLADSVQEWLFVALIYNSEAIDDIPGSLSYTKKLIEIRTPRAIQFPQKRKLSITFAFAGDLYQKLKQYQPAIYYWKKSLEIKKAIRDTPVLFLLQNISLAYSYLGMYDSSGYYARKQLEIDQKEWSDSSAIKSLLSQARAEQNLIRYNKALLLYDAAIQKAKKSKLYDLEAVALNNKAGLLHLQSKLPEALSLYFESLRIAEQRDKKDIIASNFNDMGSLYKTNKDYEKAAMYFKKAADIFSEIGATEMVAIAKNNHSRILLIKGDKIAASYFIDSIATNPNYDSLNINTSRSIAKLLNGTIVESFHLANISLNEAKKRYDILAIGRNLTLLGNLYLLMTSDDTAIVKPDSFKYKTKSWILIRSDSLLNEARFYLSIMPAGELQIEVFRLLSIVKERRGEIDSAFYYFKKHQQLKDSTFNIANDKKIIELNTQYTYDKKLAIEQEKQRYVRNLWLVAGISILLLTGLTFLAWRQFEKRKHNETVTALKQEALNAQISDHFIGNTMDSIYQFIQQNKREEAGNYLLIFSRLIRKVLENSSARLIPLSDDLSILRDYIELEKLRFRNQSLNYMITIDPKIDPEQTMIPPMIFQILAENAIKHGFQNKSDGTINFIISRERQYIRCTVSDDGIGRFAASQSKSDPTRTSFGTKLAEKLILSVHKKKKRLHFEVHDLYDKNQMISGTVVNFLIPAIIMD